METPALITSYLADCHFSEYEISVIAVICVAQLLRERSHLQLLIEKYLSVCLPKTRVLHNSHSLFAEIGTIFRTCLTFLKLCCFFYYVNSSAAVTSLWKFIIAFKRALSISSTPAVNPLVMPKGNI